MLKVKTNQILWVHLRADNSSIHNSQVTICQKPQIQMWGVNNNQILGGIILIVSDRAAMMEAKSNMGKAKLFVRSTILLNSFQIY